MEAAIPRNYGADAVEIPGSRALLDELEQAGAKWAIVTSGTRGLISGWLDIMKLAHPKNLIAAEDVENGKPDPQGYLLGYRRLGLAEEEHGSGARSAVVFEDAPAGVRAGKAAGFKVVALATTHAVKQLREAGADWIVKDMRSVSLKSFDRKTGKTTVEISNALVS
jgi:glycerol 3-phosphatase-1